MNVQGIFLTAVVYIANNIKILSYQYKDPHDKDKMVLWLYDLSFHRHSLDSFLCWKYSPSIILLFPRRLYIFPTAHVQRESKDTKMGMLFHINKFSSLAAMDVKIMTSQLQKIVTWQHSESVGDYHTLHVSSCSFCIYVQPSMVDPASLIIIHSWILSSCVASITLQDHQGRLKLGQNLAHHQLLEYWPWFSK